MTRRSSIKGAASFRRLLKALPASANQRLLTFLQAAGPVIAAKMKSEIPVLAVPRPNRRAGEARESITAKVTPKTLTLKVGELTKRDVVFYAHILDTGRKAQNVKVTRGSKSYPNGINVRAMVPLHIIGKTRAAFRLETLPGYRTLMDDILRDASQGVGND